MKTFARMVFWACLLCLTVWFLGQVASTQPRPYTITIQATITAADHEIAEGYFSLTQVTHDGARHGPLAVVAQPGSDLYRYLAESRDRRVVVTLYRLPQ